MYLSHLIHTVRPCLIHTCHAMPMPCPDHERDFSRPRYSTAWARHGICELTSAIERRPVGYLPAFGFSRLPRRVPRNLSQEAYQSQMQVASVKPNNICHRQGKLIILAQGHECLYNLQHKDYDNNLVKDNCWKVNL